MFHLCGFAGPSIHVLPTSLVLAVELQIRKGMTHICHLSMSFCLDKTNVRGSIKPKQSHKAVLSKTLAGRQRSFIVG